MKVICYNLNLFALVTRSTYLRTVKYELFHLYNKEAALYSNIHDCSIIKMWSNFVIGKQRRK